MAQISYSDKFNNTIKTSYKEPSKKFFQDQSQNFEPGGMIFHSYKGTKIKGKESNHLRPLKIDSSITDGTAITLNSLPEDVLKKNITYSDCNRDRKHVLKLQSTIGKLRNKSPQTTEITTKISELEGHLVNANDALDSCVNEFYTYYKNPDTTMKKKPTSNILPESYPPKDVEIFGDKLNSCRDSQSYHSPTTVELKDRQTRPVYGTKRGLDMIGVRVYDYPKNINEELPFNTDKSGYDIKETTNTYNKKIIDQYAIKPQNRVYSKVIKSISSQGKPGNKYCENFNCLNDVYNYKNRDEVYKGECGTKSQFKAITPKIEENPQTSEFVRNDIIGNNLENTNRPSFFFRNKATFNNKNLIDNNLSLNSLKKVANTNFISQTNKFRDEVNNDYFKQQTDKIKNNLSYRG